MMKNSERIDQFKRDLKSYVHMTKELIEINDKIHDLSVKMYEVSGVSYELKEPTSSPNAYKTPMLNEIELMEQLTSKRSFVEWWLKEMDYKIDKLDDSIKEIILNCYMYSKPHDEVAFKSEYDHKVQMYRDINREISKIVIG